ncbi:IS30 family transposase ISSmi1 [bioreactor metagenome]|uniref:IS30 family transposase ISSmi1 n=1 Tax=bioreactor metagenome TaxID=1076179 RepID=A0A644YN01_9ZZZZ
MHSQKHMDIQMRRTIEAELAKKTSFKGIAFIIGKDCTTISKEIRLRRLFEQTGASGKGFNDCQRAFQRQCDLRCVCERCFSRKRLCWSCGKCTAVCTLYQKKHCDKLRKPPYVCNACTNRHNCILEKAFYRAVPAQQQYETLLAESRSGVALTEQERQHLDQLISPLLRKGQSLHHICINHADELMKSQRTLYSYVNQGLFSARNLDMPRTVRMRPRKAKPKALKVDKTCRIGRTYQQFQAFCQANPDIPARQLDSVEGVRGSAVLLTIHFVQQAFQLAFLRPSNDSQSVIDIFNNLFLALGPNVFMDVFPLLLADNGSEFSNPKAIEFDPLGNRRTQLFYCNPSAPYEKPNCENNHEMIRRCIPKGVDIGQYSQTQILLMMSHINSYARKSLGNKSPYDVFAFQYGEDTLKKFGLRKVPPDEILLSPALFK